MADQTEEQILAAAAKLSLEERVQHSNWKARSAVYDAIKAGCNSVFDPEDPVLSEYGKLSCPELMHSLLSCWALEYVLSSSNSWHFATPFKRNMHNSTLKVANLLICQHVPAFYSRPLCKSNNRWQRSSTG